MAEPCACNIEGVKRDIAHLKELSEAMFVTNEQAERLVTRKEHDSLLTQIAVHQARVSEEMALLTARVAAIDARLYLGGVGIVMLLTVFQLILNFWHPTAAMIPR